jgi:hypothetical protein
MHKEVALLCEEGMTPIEAQNALSIPQISKSATMTKQTLYILWERQPQCGDV